ncbi:MAG: DUF1573 domain-containing protein [Pirellulales bacterium]|nr:DUF1573 domain-containing protein [Pirellulales bacterium]
MPTPQHFEYYLGDVFLEPETVPRVEHRFLFTNSSADQVARLQVRSTSCGCSQVEIGREAVPPGGQTGITLRIRPNYAPEYRAESALIATGIKEFPLVVVTVSASVYPRLELRGNVQGTIQVPWGGTREVPVTAVAWQPKQAARGELQIHLRDQRAELSPVGVQRETTKRGVRRVERRWMLKLASRPEEAQQSTHEGYRDLLTVTYGQWALKHDIRWVEEPLIRAEPPRVFLRAGVEAFEHAELRLTCDRPFAILGVQAADDFSVEVASYGTAAQHVLHVRPLARRGSQRARLGSLIVSTDHQQQRRVVVPVCILYGP